MMKLRSLSIAFGIAMASSSFAGSLSRVRFLVVNPETGRPIAGQVTVETPDYTAELATVSAKSGLTQPIDVERMSMLPIGTHGAAERIIKVPLGSVVRLVQDAKYPTKEITIRVTAKRLTLNRAPSEGVSTIRTHDDISHFVNSTAGDTKSLTKGQKGVAEDSGGQQHVRGEHTEITYVVDGVPLPDTLSGRQSSVVVPSTIDSLEILTGAFAPEFGGQVAAVLNIATTPGAKKQSNSFTTQAGSFNALNSDFTSAGPLGKKANYVFDFGQTRTDNGIEPQQPYQQTAHNAAEGQSWFGKLHFDLSPNDVVNLTMSLNPGKEQIGNRTGLPASFAIAGEGYGFLGLRNADGSEAGADPTSGLLGSGPMKLKSQQDAGMDINQTEISEFATLQYQKKLGAKSSMQVALTLLHSGQSLTNNNPLVNAPTLMTDHIDNSIEYNPNATRNIHHMQGEGTFSTTLGSHKLKAGLLVDEQSGHESYNIQAASQLALDELYSLAPNLCPTGTLNGKLDVNGNPIFVASSNQYPTLSVDRTGQYEAGFLQDTWQISSRLNVNYGVRLDVYHQSQNLGQPSVDAVEWSPRINFSYKLSSHDDLRWAYNHLFNTPPLAQGAIVGQPIQPEILDQYDLALEHRMAKGQTISVGYYYKNIHNQVDVGLLIPGSEIGLYSGVNFQYGAVHGIEASYTLAPPSGTGWDAYFNGTYSTAMPSGLDNTGAQVPTFNDHDQRYTVGAGLAYLWKGGASAAVTMEYGSGLASSILPPSTNRTPRTQFDLHMTTGDRLFKGRGGLGLDVTNLFDDRTVINFQSAFSGTRFQMGRSILLSAFYKF